MLQAVVIIPDYLFELLKNIKGSLLVQASLSLSFNSL